MAQNITLMGASYSAVPGVQLPKTGGGTALFTDVTDTTAAAADVATGKYFYTAAGVRTEGTNAGGGGGSVSQDAQGYIVLPSTGGSDYSTVTVTINSPDDLLLFMPVIADMGGDDYILTFTQGNGVFTVPLYKGKAIIGPDAPYILSNVSGSLQDLGGALLVTGNASFTIVVDPDA